MIVSMKDIEKLNPCVDPHEVAWRGNYKDWEGELTDLLEADFIPLFYRIWVGAPFLTYKDKRLFAIWCTRQALSEDFDADSEHACIIAEKFVNSEVTKEELAEAFDNGGKFKNVAHVNCLQAMSTCLIYAIGEDEEKKNLEITLAQVYKMISAYGTDMERIMPRTFDNAINAEGLTFILFSSKNCEPCDKLKESIKIVQKEYPEIKYYEFQKDQLGSDEIIKKYYINFIPRVIFFKKGAEVGRLLLYKSPELLRKYIKEVIDTGVILSDPQDVDEVTRFGNSLKKHLPFALKSLPAEQMEKNCEKWSEITYDIIEKYPNWRFLTDEQLTKIIKNNY